MFGLFRRTAKPTGADARLKQTVAASEKARKAASDTLRARVSDISKLAEIFDEEMKHANKGPTNHV